MLSGIFPRKWNPGYAWKSRPGNRNSWQTSTITCCSPCSAASCSIIQPARVWCSGMPTGKQSVSSDILRKSSGPGSTGGWITWLQKRTGIILGMCLQSLVNREIRPVMNTGCAGRTAVHAGSSAAPRYCQTAATRHTSKVCIWTLMRAKRQSSAISVSQTSWRPAIRCFIWHWSILQPVNFITIRIPGNVWCRPGPVNCIAARNITTTCPTALPWNGWMNRSGLLFMRCMSASIMVSAPQAVNSGGATRRSGAGRPCLSSCAMMMAPPGLSLASWKTSHGRKQRRRRL